MTIKGWVTTLRQKYNKNYNDTGIPTTAKEVADLMDRADRFDKLISQPGWEDVCRFWLGQVNSQIAEAVNFPYEPNKQAVMVSRWDAKRDLVDSTMAMIDDCCKERDRLVNEFKKNKE